MEHQALYRKFRPSDLGDVVGQKYTVATLREASKKNMFSHAYLFSGCHGSGKTSCARILAALINCENVKDGKNCGECKPCQKIINDMAMDVVEMDAAQNRGIDDIKNIIESVQYPPAEMKKKVIIIDEVHQLTKEATSALLKTLEEPPSYLHFILCTTEASKIISTIKSRCQKFNFSKIPSKEIAKRLVIIAVKENVNIEESACLMLGKLAKGSMRDAIGYLDQIRTVCSKTINDDVIRKFYGVQGNTSILAIIKNVVDGNLPSVLKQIDDLLLASVDVAQILLDMSEMFRNMMVMKVSPELVDLTDFEKDYLVKISQSLNMDQLLKLAHAFADVDKKITYNINERWILETVLMECSLNLMSKK